MNMIIGSNSEEIAAMIEAFDKACQTYTTGGSPTSSLVLLPSGLSKQLRWVSATLINFVNGP
jgi:hypothetical protein